MTTLMQTLAAADQVVANMQGEINVLAKEKADFIANMDALISNLTTYIESVKATVEKAYDDRMNAIATIIGDVPPAVGSTPVVQFRHAAE
jgi:hypothetical protein